MAGNPYRHDKSEMEELLKLFHNLKNGLTPSYIDEDDFEKIIDYYDDADNMALAFDAASVAADCYPYSATLLMRKADYLIQLHRYMEAIDLLDEVELLDNRDVNLYLLRAEVYLAMNKPEKADEVREKALDVFEGEDRTDFLFELAEVYDDYEDFEKIYDCIALILEKEPLNEEALYKICFWTDYTGRNEESIHLHQHIIDEHPYCELAWFNLATAYQGLKLYEKAIDAYKYVIAIDEKFDYAYRNMGDAYIRLRKYKEAIEVLKHLVTLLTKPEDVILEAIGHCYDKLENYKQARFYYNEASRLNPDDSRIYYKIACTYIKEEQWAAAITQLENAMRIHRNTPDYNLAMGECKLQLGEVKEAIIYFSSVVRSKPRNAAGWEALIRCLYSVEYYEEALEQAKAALKHTDGKSVFYYYQSAIYFAMGKGKEGLLQLERAMDIAPRKVKMFLELNPQMLQNQKVVDLIATYKRGKNI